MSARLLRCLSALLVVLGLLVLAPADPARALGSAPCGVLADADLAVSSPPLTGTVPTGGACWTLPSAPGDVVRVGDLSDYSAIDWTVVDGAGSAVACVAETRGVPVCTLSGPAPYELRAGWGSWSQERYRTRVVRLSDPSGCDPLMSAAPGESIAAQESILAAHDIACWRGPVATTGPHLLRAPEGAVTTLRSTAGVLLCTGRTEACEIPAGDVVQWVRSDAQGGVSATAGVVDLAAAGSCPELPSDWTAEPVRAVASAYDVDCRSVGAEPGDVVAIASDLYPWRSRVVRADGRPACGTGTAPEVCRLDGEAPYRLLSWDAQADGSAVRPPNLVARNVTQHIGCAQLAVTAADAPDSPGGGPACRVLGFERSGPHLVAVADDWEGLVVDGTGREVCRVDEAGCDLVVGKTYVLMGHVTGATVPSSVLRRLDGEGCPALAAHPGSVWTLPAGSQADGCATLAQPAGATITAVAQRDRYPGFMRVLDATGASVCWGDLTDKLCRLAGPAPFRMVRSGDSLPMSVVRLDESDGCAPLPGGAFGTAAGADVTFAAGEFSACLTVPRADFAAETIVAFERLDGRGQVEMQIRDAFPGGCGSDAGEVGLTYCSLHEPASPQTTVVLIGDGEPGTWRVVRHPKAGDDSCAPLASTEPGGAAASARLASFVALDCYEVAADPDDTLIFDLHADDEDVAIDVSGAATRSCREHGWSPCAMTGSPSYRVVVRDRGYQSTVPAYDLTAWNVGRPTAPASTCMDVPVRGARVVRSLSKDEPGACVRLTGRTYDIAPGPGVEVVSVDDLTPGYEGVHCSWDADIPGYGCDDRTFFDSPPTHRTVLLLRRDGAHQVELDAELTCPESQCPAERPIVSRSPAIVGVAAAGRTVHADPGAWEPTPTEFVYSWLIDGETVHYGADLLLSDEHVGHELRVQVRALRGTEAGWAVSEPVTVGPAVGPALVTSPSVLGSGRVGTELQVRPGTWAPTPERVVVTWLADGRVVPGPSGSRLAVGPDLLGRRVAARVRVEGMGAATTVVTSAVLVRAGAAPTPVHGPTLVGRASVGRTVLVVPAKWSVQPQRVDYRWTVAGRALGSTGPRLRLGRALAGKRVVVTVTAYAPGRADGRVALTFRVRGR